MTIFRRRGSNFEINPSLLIPSVGKGYVKSLNISENEP
jgi:hypothetical protein